MLTDEFSPLHFCHGGSSFFGLVIKNLLKRVYHVRDGEHFVLKTITRNSRRKIDRK